MNRPGGDELALPGVPLKSPPPGVVILAMGPEQLADLVKDTGCEVWKLTPGQTVDW